MNLKVPSVLNEHSKSPLALQKGGTSFFLVVCLVELLALAKAPPVFWSKLFFLPETAGDGFMTKRGSNNFFLSKNFDINHIMAFPSNVFVHAKNLGFPFHLRNRGMS